MLGKISPWGLAAFFAPVLGLLSASLVGERRLTIGLAVLGLVIVALGIPATWRRRETWGWLGLGAALSGLVLSVVLLAPGLLNKYWAIDVSLPQEDPNRLVLVPIDEPMDEGRPLADGEWADAAKEGIRQDDLFVRLDSVTAGRLPEKGPAVYLLINFHLTQIRWERTNTFHGFAGETHRPVLTDDSGRSYAFLSHRPRKPFKTKFDMPVSVDHILVFALPPGGIESLKIGSLKLEVPASAWGRQGVCRILIKNIETEAAPDLPKLVAQYKALLRSPPGIPPDAPLGRMLFNKNCMECHTLYGIGSKIGPDLTDRRFPDGRLKRGDLDFLVTNIVDPSAEIDKEYQPSIVTTTAGVVYIGIVREHTGKAVKLQTSSRVVVVPNLDIEEIRESKVSLMPTELLKTFDDHQVRSLLAYLSGPAQVPLLATHENAVYFSSAPGVGRAELVQDPLTFWDNAGARWKLDQDDIVSSGPQKGMPALLISHLLLADDFHMALQFHPGKEGRGAIQVRDEAGPGLVPSGLRVEFSAGGPVVLTAVEEERSPAPAEAPAREAPNSGGIVKADVWNKLEIIGAAGRISIRLNGKDAAAKENAKSARRMIALEGPAASGHEVRFRNLDLRLLSPHKRNP